MAEVKIDVYTDTHGSPAKLKEVSGGLKSVDDQSKNVKGSWGSMMLQFAGGQMIFSTVVKILSGAGGLARSFLDVAVQSEQYEIRLRALLGSQDKASAAMAYFKEVAAKVPATLGEVISSGTTLVAFGLDIQKWTPVLSDLSAVMGMDMPEAAAALGRAFAGGAGAADIFRERGILNIIKDSQRMRGGIDDLTKLSLPQFREAMFQAFTDPDGKISGAATMLASSWSGIVSMLEDKWYSFKDTVMKSAVFEVMKRGLEEVNKALDQWIASGDMEKWAIRTARAVLAAFRSIAEAIEFLGETWYNVQALIFTGAAILLDQLVKSQLGMLTVMMTAAKYFPPLRGMIKNYAEAVGNLAVVSQEYKDIADKKVESGQKVGATFDAIEGFLSKYIIELDNAIPKTKESSAALGDLSGKADTAGGSISKLKLEVTKSIPAHRELKDVLRLATPLFEDVADGAALFEYNLKTVADRAKTSEATVLAFLYNVRVQFLSLMGIFLPQLQIVEEQTGKSIGNQKSMWDGLYNDIASSMGRTMGDFVSEIAKGMDFANGEFWEHGINFKKFFETIFGDIKDAFFRMIGQMLTDKVLGLFGSFFSTAAEAGKKAMDTAASTAVSGASDIVKGAAGAISGLWTGLGAAVGSFLGTLLGGGGGLGKTEGHWIHETRDRAYDIMHTLDNMFANHEDIRANYWPTMISHLDEQIGYLDSIDRGIRDLAGYLKEGETAQGGLDMITSRPQVVFVHPRERVQVTPNINVNPGQTIINLDGRAVALAIAPYTTALEKAGVKRTHTNSFVSY